MAFFNSPAEYIQVGSFVLMAISIVIGNIKGDKDDCHSTWAMTAMVFFVVFIVAGFVSPTGTFDYPYEY